MAKNNVNSLVIGEIAGHSSLQTTMKYVHADAKTRANAVAGIYGMLVAVFKARSIPMP